MRHGEKTSLLANGRYSRFFAWWRPHTNRSKESAPCLQRLVDEAGMRDLVVAESIVGREARFSACWR